MTSHPNVKLGETQKEEIIDYMQKYGSITPLDALLEFGCMRLAARIGDLKADGHTISSKMIAINKAKGRGVTHVCSYSTHTPPYAVDDSFVTVID